MGRVFQVKSSDGVSFYNVVIDSKKGKLAISCDCAAGLLGKLCKHKEKIVECEVSILRDRAQEKVLLELESEFRSSSFSKLLNDVKAAEKMLDRAKSELSASKRALEKAMKEGC